MANKLIRFVSSSNKSALSDVLTEICMPIEESVVELQPDRIKEIGITQIPALAFAKDGMVVGWICGSKLPNILAVSEWLSQFTGKK
jgi:uncharacterized protein (UPF0261 family)